jgi:hypothetical protein
MKISATVTLAMIASIKAEIAMARCFFWGGSEDVEEAKGWVRDSC